MAKLTNDSNDQTYIYHQLTIHNSHDSEDDFLSGCRNVSQCQQLHVTRTVTLNRLLILLDSNYLQ